MNISDGGGAVVLADVMERRQYHRHAIALSAIHVINPSLHPQYRRTVDDMISRLRGLGVPCTGEATGEVNLMTVQDRDLEHHRSVSRCHQCETEDTMTEIRWRRT